MTVLYIDVSHHDWSRHGGQLDWARVREATSPAMCARATYGDPQGFNPTSRYFKEFISGARAAGFDLLGAYHNLVRGDQASINRQVDYLRREMDRAGANWAMLDVERYPELVDRGLQPRFSDAVAFCDRWRAVEERVLTVYLPKWIWADHMGRPDLRKLHAPLVASNYGSNPDGSPASAYRARGGDAGAGWNAYGGVTPTIWQYGSEVDCPGASVQTDLNAFRGSLTELRALLNPQEDDDGMATMDQATFDKRMAGALTGTSADAKSVQNAIRRLPWAYPITKDASALNVLFGQILPALVAGQKTIGEAIAREAANPDEVRALLANMPTQEQIADAVLAGFGQRSLTDVLAALEAAGVDLAELRAELERQDAGAAPAGS